MYIYKSSTGNQRKKEMDPSLEVGKKSSSHNWLYRIYKTRTLKVGNGSRRGSHTAAEAAGEFAEARKSTSCLELGSPGGILEGRKSVSSIEGAGGGGEMVGGRKSVSHIEGKLAGRGMAEGRKSVSQIETLSSVAAYLQVKVLVTDMPGVMQVRAFRCARRTYDSLEQFSAKHVAYNLKKEFDKAYGPLWHCIVGSSFGSFVTHSTGCFLYFSMEKLCILLFKTKVKRALN